MVLRVTEKIKMEKRERTAIPNRIISEALTERGILEQKRFGSMKLLWLSEEKAFQAEGTATINIPRWQQVMKEEQGGHCDCCLHWGLVAVRRKEPGRVKEVTIDRKMWFRLTGWRNQGSVMT